MPHGDPGLRERSELKLPRPRTGLLGLRLSALAERTRESGRLVAAEAAPGELGSKRKALTEGGPDPVRLPSGSAGCPEDAERP